MVPGEDPIPAALDDLREHDREVLEFLSGESDAQVGFQGIRRRLGIHPEQLSRALSRLARDDLVDRTDLGYRITPKAMEIMSPTALAPARPLTPILQTYIPADVDLRALVQSLKGNWVGSLRWYGLRESQDGLRLTWMTEDDGIRLEAWFRPGALVIVAEVELPQRIDEAARLGHMLFQHVAREFSRGATGLSG